MSTDPLVPIQDRHMASLPGPWKIRILCDSDRFEVAVSVVSEMLGGDPVQITAETHLPEDPWQKSQIIADHVFMASAPDDIRTLIRIVDTLELAVQSLSKSNDSLNESFGEMSVLLKHWQSEATREYRRAQAAEDELAQVTVRRRRQ